MQGNNGCLILVCGLPGAGKTTLAKKLAIEKKAIRMCPDDWIEALIADPLDTFERDRLRDPTENLQWDLAKEYLEFGYTVVLENGFWGEDERFQYAFEALELDARIELYYLQVPKDELWRRIQDRNQNMPTKTFMMTRDEVEMGWRLFQEPTDEELEFYDHAEVVRT